MLFVGATVLMIALATVILVSLWEMFDNEEGIDD
jgi:hypothetical protein